MGWTVSPVEIFLLIQYLIILDISRPKFVEQSSILLVSISPG